jgi:peptidyl-prolyl cis-trans isomerase C
LAMMLFSVCASATDPNEVVVAERDGVRVTLHEVDAQVMQLPKHLRAGYLDSPERIEQVVGGLLLNKQMAAQAIEWGVESDPYFQAQLEAAKADLLGKRARAINEDQLLANQPDFSALAEEIFLTHPHRFKRPPTLKLEHILVYERGRSNAEATERAERARALLLEGSRPFSEIFNEFSDEALDPRGLSNGVLNDVVPGMTELPFEQAAFALREPGEVSEVIRTKFGFHVIRLLEREVPPPSTLEEVKPMLILEQQNAHLQQGKTRFMSGFVEGELLATPAVVAQLRTRYANAAKGELPVAVTGNSESAETDSKLP